MPPELIRIEHPDIRLRVRQELRHALDVHQRHRAIHQAHAVGDEERLRLRQGTAREDQRAVEQPAAQADREADQDRRTLSDRVDQRDRHHGHEGDDAADGEVKEPRHDDEGHPEGGEDQHSELADDVVEVLGGEELRLDDRGDDHQQGDRYPDWVVLQEVDGCLRGHPPIQPSRRCAHANSKALAMISSAEAVRWVELPVDPPVADRVDTVAHVEDLRQLRRDQDDRTAILDDLLHQQVDLVLGAHVDALGWLVHDQDPGIHLQPPAQDRLLLVSARQRPDLGPSGRRLDVERLDLSIADAALLLGVDEASLGQSGQDRQRDVLLDREPEQQALELPVLGHHGKTEVDGIDRAVDLDGLAVEIDALLRDLVGPEQGSHQLRAPRAHQAHQAQDLALPEGELDIAQLPGADALDLEDRLAGAIRPGGYSFSMVRPTIIEIISLREIDADIPGVDHVPVPHHGHHVAEAEDLVQLVRDVDDRDALGLQVVDDLDELLHLIRREAAARLVHDDELRVEGQRLGDLHHLLVRDAQLGHRLWVLTLHPMLSSRARALEWTPARPPDLLNLPRKTFSPTVIVFTRFSSW